jgi:diguanylate cyclase
MFRWLFLNESGISPAEHTRWKISALRIILVSGFVLEALIAIHSSIDAVAIGAYQVVAIVISFYALLTSGLYCSTRHPDLGAGILIATVYAAGASIVFFVQVDEIAKLGIIFVYTTPIIARLFFGGRVALALMLLNFLPFSTCCVTNPSRTTPRSTSPWPAATPTFSPCCSCSSTSVFRWPFFASCMHCTHRLSATAKAVLRWRPAMRNSRSSSKAPVAPS